MATDYQIKDEKLQYEINREAAKISALLSGKTNEYEYLTGEGILPSQQNRMIGQAKFTYSPFGKTFKRETKTIEDQGENEVEAIKEYGKQIIESNEVTKNDFNIDRSDVSNKKQKEILDKLVKERAFEFFDIKDIIDPNI